MVVFLAVFVSLAYYFWFSSPLGFEHFNEVKEFLCLSCECCQDDSETSMFSVFAVLNFDIRCSVDSTNLDEHERKVFSQ